MATHLTLWQSHVEKWKECTRCSLCKTRKHVVLARGKVPADVLIVGEAPGVSEDVLGRPFVGPAGKLLDEIVERALDGQYDYALTNLVACIPLGEDGSKTGEPPEESIEACRPRLRELFQIARPRLTVLVGKLATKHAKPSVYLKKEALCCDIIHPAAILRMDVSQQGLAMQRCVATIEAALDDFS